MANPGIKKSRGGILSDQNLMGSLIYFKMTKTANDFGYIVSDDDEEFVVNFHSEEDNTNMFFFERIPEGDPIPNSSVELALRTIAEKASISQISLVDTNEDGRIDEVHFCLDNKSVGWVDQVEVTDGGYTYIENQIDDAAMQAAVRELGTVTVVSRTTNGITFDTSNTTQPATEDIDLSDVVIENVDFVLA